ALRSRPQVSVSQDVRVLGPARHGVQEALSMRYLPGWPINPRSRPHRRGATAMLAAGPAAVKFDVPATPEQRACSQAIDQTLNAFWPLVERLRAASREQQPIHQVEETIFRGLLAMGRCLLQAFVASAGDGDLGPSLTLPGDSPAEPDRTLPRRDTLRTRPYLSIFGEVVIERVSYGEGPVDVAPLDARLHLPRRQYSYLLQ